MAEIVTARKNHLGVAEEETIVGPFQEEHQSESSTGTKVEVRAEAEQTDNPVQDELQEKPNNTIEVKVQVENFNTVQNDTTDTTNQGPFPGPRRTTTYIN